MSRLTHGMRGDPANRMFTTAKELLWRQRRIELFPCDKEEVLLSLLPPGLQDQLIVDSSEIAVQWSNLTHCVSKDRQVIVELRGEAGHAFWMRFNLAVIAPSNSSSFAMIEDNIHYAEVKAWWDRATKIHTELTAYQSIIWDFLQRANHPKLVEKYWPDFLPFVDFELMPSMLEPNMSKRRVVPMPDDKSREGIIETLAGSTLLPTYECTAWVDYEAGS